MEFVIVTGLSGSGKTTALNALEDIGYFSIDNLPLQLLLKFAELFKENGNHEKIALVTDVRVGVMFSRLDEYVSELKKSGFFVKVLFLDSKHDVIVKRYKETRRKHPLDAEANGDVELAVEIESKILMPIRANADYYIDTSYMPAVKLKECVLNFFIENLRDSIAVRCVSFGYKHGIPHDADLVFDVRCLPNPFYVEELKKLTGLDEAVRDYVMASGISRGLLDRVCDMSAFLIPEYIREGKSQLVIAFGCTGGHHRSVTFAEKLADFLREKEYHVAVMHRDITK